MVQALSKLANPWKCDNAPCGVLRANDANHWLIVRRLETSCLRCEVHGTTAEHDRHLAQPMDHGDASSEIVISKWRDELAELPESKHVCGIDCGLKVTARMIADAFFPADCAGKEISNA